MQYQVHIAMWNEKWMREEKYWEWIRFFKSLGNAIAEWRKKRQVKKLNKWNFFKAFSAVFVWHKLDKLQGIKSLNLKNFLSSKNK